MAAFLPGVGADACGFEAGWRSAFVRAFGAWPMRVIDVGAGRGEAVLLLRKLGHRAVGVESDPALVEEARREASRRGSEAGFRIASPDRIPCGGGTFDAVLARDLLWRVPDPVAAVREWTRVLAPRGMLAVMEEVREERGLLGRVRDLVGPAGRRRTKVFTADGLMRFLGDLGAGNVESIPGRGAAGRTVVLVRALVPDPARV